MRSNRNSLGRVLLLATVLLMVAGSFTHAWPAGKKRGGKGGKVRPGQLARKGDGGGGKQEALPSNPSVARRQEIYKQVGGVALNVNIFEPAKKEAGKQYPAIVFFFGGGFKVGEPSEFFRQCEHLASRGMIAMSANYRVSSRQPGTTALECLKDGKSAIRWARANAQRLGLDPARIAAGGGSAGGYIAAGTAMSPGFDEAGEDLRISSRPNALVLFNPGLGYFDANPDARDPVNYAILHKNRLWPVQNVRAGLPPAIIMFGTKDDVIPVPVGKRFQAMMQAAGNTCELRIYPGQRHGFFNYGSQPNHQYYFTTLAEMDRFLVSLGWIPGGGLSNP